MSSPAAPLPGPWPVLRSQIRYQVTLLLRTPRAFLLALIIPGALLVIELQVKRPGTHASTAAVISEIGGLAVFATLSIAYLTYAATLIVAREEGVLRRWHATPIPAGAYFAGRIIAYVALADASGLVLLLVGIAMAGLHMTPGGAIGLLVAVTLGALALAATGTAITPMLASAQTANPVLTLTYLPLLIFSGGFGALPGLPHWLTTTMTYLPVQPVIHAVMHSLQHTGGGFALMSARDLAVLAGWALGGLLLSVRFFRWDPSRPGHARRDGASASTSPA
jgi:ABC-2 type transport system permease protein